MLGMFVGARGRPIVRGRLMMAGTPDESVNPGYQFILRSMRPSAGYRVRLRYHSRVKLRAGDDLEATVPSVCISVLSCRQALTALKPAVRKSTW